MNKAIKSIQVRVPKKLRLVYRPLGEESNNNVFNPVLLCNKNKYTDIYIEYNSF